MNTKEAVETYQNGNIGDFRGWLKRSSKLAVLDAIEELNDRGEEGLKVVRRVLSYE